MIQQNTSLLACYDNSLDKLNSILRDYQINCINGVKDAFTKGLMSPLLQSPTGSGKSIMILAIAVEALLNGERVGLIIHKEELLKQWMNHFEKWLPGFSRGILGDKSRYGKLRDLEAPLQIMTIKTLHRLKDKPHLDLLIFDECHHIPAGEWTAVLKYYRESGIKKVLGATATPIRLDGKGLDSVEFKVGSQKEVIPAFNTLIPGPQTYELINRGHLVPVELYVGKKFADMDGVRMRGGDFSASEATEKVIIDVPVETVWEQWFEIAPDKLTIAYPVSVEYSKSLCKYFNEKVEGIARHIDADTPSGEREQIFADYFAGKFKVLFQHSIVIEGVDIPSVECVLNIRPTASKAVWLQILGRGLRPAPGKTKMILIDFTDNHLRLPMVEDEIIWSLSGAKTHNFFDCECCKKERRFFLINETEDEYERVKFFECSKCNWDLKLITEIKPKEVKEEEEKEKFTGKLTRKRLNKRYHDFTYPPDFYQFFDRVGDQTGNLIDYIIAEHTYRLERNQRKPIKPFSRLFTIWDNFDKEDIEPTWELLYLINQAFCDDETANNPELELPEKCDSIARRKTYKAIGALGYVGKKKMAERLA